ncbi:MAG: chromate transporter, partial [Planctomycetota bacterium JB042]
FGGGHVVLPLLQNVLGETVPTDRFLTGYAAAQAIPGPMFSLAGFLGAELSPGAPWGGAVVATLGIFLPGFLLVLGLHGAWERLTAAPRVAGAAAGLNASVVGLLLAALYRPIFTSAVGGPVDMAVVVAAAFLLVRLRAPVLLVVLLCAAYGWGTA